MEKIFENFTVSVLKLHRLIQRIKLFEMREYGLKSIHVMCIYYLDERREGLTAAELVALTYEDKGAVSRALSLLREKGYIEYNAKKYNSLIKLTEKGREVSRFVSERAERAVKAGSAKLTEEERELFYKSLHEIAENLKLYYSVLMGNGEE